ncbi:amino acid ABC transporter ATP-binding protein [Sphingosinicella soli]|uniref:Polar amino acid transport system ATP-binding protein n=1 Tax=Sphingosinicella soli TaxID=333708 RepID=A0A7W7AYV7_9SPHN|nr:amino acid ABC transporter ATP-binding protein [Sphingosinicella soli]MBB4630901.1 polar amino acid transport system ATP-binding protein [Sphingosinicella soli]
MIRLRHVRKSFGACAVLRDVSFDIAAGEVACLIGPSGSGKSTILRCVNGLESHDGGSIEVDNVLVTPRSLPQIRSAVSMVFQRFNLFPHRTALENVIEGPVHVLRRPIAEAREHAMALLEKVGMADHADALPRQLSGGQQQRVGIARALAMEPRAILLDEPTSALDPERVGEVLEVIRGLAEGGMTMIVVTHEIAFAREAADSILFVDGGTIAEQGPANEFLANPKTERTRLFLRRVRHTL